MMVTGVNDDHDDDDSSTSAPLNSTSLLRCCCCVQSTIRRSLFPSTDAHNKAIMTNNNRRYGVTPRMIMSRIDDDVVWRIMIVDVTLTMMILLLITVSTDRRMSHTVIAFQNNGSFDYRHSFRHHSLEGATILPSSFLLYAHIRGTTTKAKDGDDDYSATNNNNHSDDHEQQAKMMFTDNAVDSALDFLHEQLSTVASISTTTTTTKAGTATISTSSSSSSSPSPPLNQYYQRDENDPSLERRPLPHPNVVAQLLYERYVARNIHRDYNDVDKIDDILIHQHGIYVYDNPNIWTRKSVPPQKYQHTHQVQRRIQRQIDKYGPMRHSFRQQRHHTIDMDDNDDDDNDGVCTTPSTSSSSSPSSSSLSSSSTSITFCCRLTKTQINTLLATWQCHYDDGMYEMAKSIQYELYLYGIDIDTEQRVWWTMI